MNIISSNKKKSIGSTINSTSTNTSNNVMVTPTKNNVRTSNNSLTPRSITNTIHSTPGKSSTNSSSNRGGIQTPSSLTPISSSRKVSTPSTSKSIDVYQVVKNAALSSNERNTEQCTRAIQHFANGKYDLAYKVIAEQATKSFLSKLILYKCCYHMDMIGGAMKALQNLHNAATTLSERGEEDVIGGVQVRLMMAQVVLFKLIPKRLSFKCLLVEEEECTKESSLPTDLDVIHDYLGKIGNLLESASTDLKKLEKEWKDFDSSEDLPVDIMPIIKHLGWFIKFFKGVIHLRYYQYNYSKEHYNGYKKILEEIFKSQEFLHVDFFYTYAHLLFLEDSFEDALTMLYKADRAFTHCKQTIENQGGGTNATDAMWLLDVSAHSEVIDMIRDLKSKIIFSQYLEKRMVLREVYDQKELEKLIRDIKDINAKRRQHNAKLAEQTKQFDEFLGVIAQTKFKNFDCSIIEKFRIYGQYRYVVHLTKKLLSSEDDNLTNNMRVVCVHYLIEALYKMKKFSECVSTYCVHSNLFKGIPTNQQQRLIHVNYIVVDSFITINLEGGSVTLKIQDVDQLLKENLKLIKDSRHLYLAVRLYKLLSNNVLAAACMKRLFTSIQESSSTRYDEFFSETEQHSSRSFTIKLGTSKSLIATPNKNSSETPQKKTPLEAQKVATEEELAIYSTFEDFSPHRLQNKMKKQNQALSELKRKREAQAQSSKKIKLE